MKMSQSTPREANKVPSADRLANARLIVTRNIQPVLLGAIVLYIFLLVLFGASTDSFFSVSNARSLLTQIAVLGIVAFGQLLVILSGGFDLSVAGVIPLAGVLFVSLSNSGVSTIGTLIIVVVICLVYGSINGFFVTALEVSPLVATLATMSIAQGLAFTVTNGLTSPLANASAAFLSQTRLAGVPVFAYIFVGIAMALFVVLKWTVYGRSIYATGGGREAARLSGMRVGLITTSSYALSGGFAGLAGIILASQLLAGSPTVGADMALTSIAAVVLGGAALRGGVGGVGGTLVGILILGTLTNGMALLEVPTFYQLIATGLVLLIAVSIGRARFRSFIPHITRARGVRTND